MKLSYSTIAIGVRQPVPVGVEVAIPVQVEPGNG